MVFRIKTSSHWAHVGSKNLIQKHEAGSRPSMDIILSLIFQSDNYLQRIYAQNFQVEF